MRGSGHFRRPGLELPLDARRQLQLVHRQWRRKLYNLPQRGDLRHQLLH